MKTLKRLRGLYQPGAGCALYLPGLPGGGSIIYDRSPYGNIGTITGATWTRLPSGIWALDFDGVDDYVDLGSSALLGGLTQLSIGCWINVDSLASERRIFERGQSGNANKILFAASSTGNVYLLINNTDTIQGGSLSVDAWYHVFCTWIGLGAKVAYINGAIVASGTATESSVATGSISMRIGKSPWYALEQFDGTIALFRIYNRALSALEIQRIFNQEKHLFGV